jgi:ribose/xylose/arabinose/galactoside ABC-type transport system permease subunit
MLGIYSLGMAFVIIAGGIDLSIGSVILTGVLIAKLSSPGQAALATRSGSAFPSLSAASSSASCRSPHRV